MTKKIRALFLQAFNKKRADDRKQWLTDFMHERKRCRAADEPEPGSTLYTSDTKSLSYEDFVNKELVMFSCADLERSVPSLVDGERRRLLSVRACVFSI